VDPAHAVSTQIEFAQGRKSVESTALQLCYSVPCQGYLAQGWHVYEGGLAQSVEGIVV
jgi:hypothetical protein